MTLELELPCADPLCHLAAPPTMSDLQSLDVSRLLLGHAVLSGIAALWNAPPWNVPIALYGLVTVQLDGANSAEAIRTETQFVLVLGGSFLLDLLWLVGPGEWGVLIFLNLLLKPVTLLAALGQLRQRGESTFGVNGGFSLPAGISDRIPGGFPPFASHRQNETVWTAPPPQHSSYQTRFSLDDDVEAGHVPPPKSASPSLKKAAPPPPTTGTPAAEGGGYHTLE
ncbi:hypothetical protein JCM1841_004182 [Sporobolomyces salmonicolor]